MAFYTDLENLPDGAVVAIGVADDASQNLRPYSIKLIKEMGSNLIGKLQYRESWAFIGIKG